MTKGTERALDDIYAGPPAKFTQARDALAKQLRADGDAEKAARVKALRKPSKAAAVLNALSLHQPEAVARYLGLAEELREVTSGRVDAKRMRELAREEGELLEALVASAAEIAEGASAATLDRVRETLQAAQVDPELRERVAAGRVEREERAASVGLENLAAPPVASKRHARGSAKQTRKAPASDTRKAGAARKRREDAKGELKEARASAREAAREVARAESALAKAERERDAAERKVERAEAKLERLGP